ncbi:kelch repeat protein [Necator americanus]|uniref:Kelch repeat protein n=1 Tax=Necator americanus TaxID=51031 RepID=W2SYQ7_NECAM|nr:kelch repeat protein [Necator americanus]ETN74076.1 kelch repeat protein [Necator americanus]
MGGRNQSCIFSSVERFCIEKRNWEPVPDMHEGRYFFGATAVNDKIYVFGGESTKIHKFNVDTAEWVPGPEIPLRFQFAFGAAIYIPPE